MKDLNPHFFSHGDNAPVDSIRGISFKTLREHECALCPLNTQKGFTPKTPHMPAHGDKQARIYLLGEAPGKEEDQQGIPFVGEAGRFLHKRIPKQWRDHLRWSNCVRTRPKNNETPNTVAIECCRPSVQSDIEAVKPEAIFGFGNIPLQWATGQIGITKWNGRRMPVTIGKHSCWYFPLLHPSYILHLDNESTRKQHEEMSFVFDLDVRRAFEAVEQGLPDPVIHTRADAEEGIDCLYNLNSIAEALEEFEHEKTVGIDIETVGTRPYDNSACILSIALSTNRRTVVFPIYHREAKWKKQERQDLDDLLYKFLTNCEGRKISFALPFELEWLAYFYGEEIIYSGKWGDAQAQTFLLDGRRGSLSLEFVCLQLFGINVKAINNTDRNNLDGTPIETVLQYNAIDAKYHRLAHKAQMPVIIDSQLKEVYEHHIRRTQAAVLTQLKGVPIDQDVVESLADKYEKRLKSIEKNISKDPLAKEFKAKHGYSYRPSAPKDTLAIFRPIGIHLDSAQEEALLKVKHPLAKLHLDWKEAGKALSTYILPLRASNTESCIFPDGKLHPLLSLHKTRTWRSSSEGPNIQNFPKHYGEMHEIRDAIRPPVGHVVVAFDYGQIQARNVAMESQDEKLVQSFWDRHDIHSDWRDRIFKLCPEWPKEGLKKVLADKALMKFYRNQAKSLFVFASFFGAGGKRVARTLGIPEDIGYQLAEEFDNAFPQIKDWQDGLHEFYNENGFVTGLSGFRRYAPVAHTEVINTPIQSDEAIMVFDGMIRLCEQEPDFTPILMIHDDLTFIWPKKKVEQYTETVVDTLLDCPFEWAHVVPISVEMSVGESWDTMKPGETFESDLWRK